MFSISYKSDCLSLQSEVSVHLKLGASDVSELKKIEGESGVCFRKSSYSVSDIQDIAYEIANKHPFKNLELIIDDSVLALFPTQTWIQWLGFGFSLAGYNYHHSPSWKLNPTIKKVEITTDNLALKKAHCRGIALARAQAYSRELMNKPANVIYPETFISAVKGMDLLNVKIHSVAEDRLRELGFGGLVGVSQGSKREGHLLVLDYHPDGAQKTIVIVGKGVTFDSGGISIKNAKSMSTMKFDMGGAAAVVGAIHAISESHMPARVIGLCGLVENMPSGNALRPGDVVTMLSGKSVEIISTDAEGRMVLADVLHYAQQTYQPDYLIDMATLTGGAGIALGKGYSALMGTDEGFKELARIAGEACGEPVWPMPIGGWFETALESDYADLQHGSEDPHGSPCVAATFLNHFVQNGQKWIHLDTAAMSTKMPHRRIYEKGATGYGALLLTQICQEIVNSQEEGSL